LSITTPRLPEDAWHLITGEYPPQAGGVSDYTALLAEALAGNGTEVHVWCPKVVGTTPSLDGVTVHRINGNWSPTALACLDEQLGCFALPRKLLIQYAPNSWGYKGLNFGFANWLVKRRNAGDDVRVMVHEPFYPWRLWDKPTRWFLAAGHRWMIRTVLSASSRAYISIPAWERRLRTYEPVRRRLITWLPIPSTIPIVSDTVRVSGIRRQLGSQDQVIVGTFGTFSPRIRKMLTMTLAPLLVDHPERVGLLLGRGGKAFAAELLERYPHLAGQLVASGELSAELLSLHLQACDLLIQPYPDGVSSRRTSVMAGLAHGVPIVTTQGFLSESVWAETGCVILTPATDHEAQVAAAESLIGDSLRRSSLSKQACATYTKYFTLEHTVRTILGS
jgi:glycosyltransferase involved in cell wall biosynthesis